MNTNNRNSRMLLTWGMLAGLPDHVPFNEMVKSLFPDMKSQWKIMASNNPGGMNHLVWIVPRRISSPYIKNFDRMLEMMESEYVLSPIDVVDDGDKRYLVYSYESKMTTFKELIITKKIQSHAVFHTLMKKVFISYGKLNEKYGFRMFDVTPEHILFDEKLNIFWFGFLYTETKNYPLSTLNKMSQVFKTSFYFTNKMNVRYNRSIADIFSSFRNSNNNGNSGNSGNNKNRYKKNNTAKLSNNIVDLMRLIRIFNTAEKILFFDNHAANLDLTGMRVLNSANETIYNKVNYLVEHFDRIFS